MRMRRYKKMTVAFICPYVRNGYCYSGFVWFVE